MRALGAEMASTALGNFRHREDLPDSKIATVNLRQISLYEISTCSKICIALCHGSEKLVEKLSYHTDLYLLNEGDYFIITDRQTQHRHLEHIEVS